MQLFTPQHVIQVTNEMGFQYDPRLEVPDGSKTIHILLIKKIVAIVIKLNHELSKKYNQQQI